MVQTLMHGDRVGLAARADEDFAKTLVRQELVELTDASAL